MIEKPAPPIHAARTEQLRKDIDEGRTGDKNAFRDPAASPLGSDDEAAGRPPTPERVAMARGQENRPEGASNPNSTEQGRDSFNAQKGRPWPAIIIGIGLVLIAGIVVAVLFGG